MDWSAVAPAALGAVAQEVLFWYQLRTRLEQPECRSLVRSPGYWIVTVAMIVVSGLGTAFLYGRRVHEPDALFVLGAAFPLLFKKLVDTASSPSARAARAAPQRSGIRNYLRAA